MGGFRRLSDPNKTADDAQRVIVKDDSSDSVISDPNGTDTTRMHPGPQTGFRGKLNDILYSQEFQIIVIVLVIVDCILVVGELILDFSALEVIHIWSSGFFPGGTRVPLQQNFCPPPSICHPCFLRRACPPIWVFFTENFKNFTSFFSQFWLLFSSKLHHFVHKTPRFALNFAVGGIFGLSGQFFQVSPHLTPSPTQIFPPSVSVPDGDRKSFPESKSPHQKFCES